MKIESQNKEHEDISIEQVTETENDEMISKRQSNDMEE